ncbi:MAG: DUF2333 family protein [Magnetococcales bacterium]|nr:DUF2333 family protein [Magnetococcales bacterium]
MSDQSHRGLTESVIDPSQDGHSHPAQINSRIIKLFTAHSPLSTKSRLTLTSALTAAVLLYGLSVYWSIEPDLFDVKENAQTMSGSSTDQMVTGAITTATLIKVVETLLDKHGGYLSNDVMPPSILMDNMPNWEFGVLVQVRDLSRVMRNDMSRSQSQSGEDPSLANAEPQFNFHNDSWMFPASETEYRKGIGFLKEYFGKMKDRGHSNTQFYARADNLREWLSVVSKRLGGYSQRLRSSTGQERINTDLEGDPSATQSTPTKAESIVKTPWLEIDDVFYESRGGCWALLQFLKAVEVDFQAVLQDKNALVSLRQIIRELEPTQSTVWSPMILNGRGFALIANHSLVMASYISRANAAVIDLKELLAKG